jgi:hypothetical protein
MLFSKKVFLFTVASLTLSQSALAQSNDVQYTKLATMKSCYKGEELTPAKPSCLASHSFTIKYFLRDNEADIKERESYRVIFKDGLARRALTPDLVMDDDGKREYVLDDKGNFYIFNEKARKEVRHSSFMAGGPLASAGEIKISKGVITKIDGDSGHYQMNSDILQNAFDFLSKQGVNVKK